MRHNSVVSSYPKSTGILRVDGLSTGPTDFGVSHFHLQGTFLVYINTGTYSFGLLFAHQC